MRVQSGQLVSLGYGKYVRSDDVVAVDPIVEGRGPGQRTLVWVRGVPEALVASRSDAAIVDDLVTPAEEAARMRQLRSALSRVTGALERMSPAVRRIVTEEAGTDVADLIEESRRVLN